LVYNYNGPPEPTTTQLLSVSVEWNHLTVKLPVFVRDLDQKKSHFSGGKYPYKSAIMDEIYIIYIKTTWENVSNFIRIHTQIKKGNLKKNIFFLFFLRWKSYSFCGWHNWHGGRAKWLWPTLCQIGTKWDQIIGTNYYSLCSYCRRINLCFKQAIFSRERERESSLFDYLFHCAPMWSMHKNIMQPHPSCEKKIYNYIIESVINMIS